MALYREPLPLADHVKHRSHSTSGLRSQRQKGDRRLLRSLEVEELKPKPPRLDNHYCVVCS